MKIKAPKHIRFVGNKEISPDRIVFDDKGIATVSREVGEQILELYPDFVEVKTKTKK